MGDRDALTLLDALQSSEHESSDDDIGEGSLPFPMRKSALPAPALSGRSIQDPDAVGTVSGAQVTPLAFFTSLGPYSRSQ